MDLTGTVISCLLSVIALLLGILYRSSTNIVEALQNLKEDFREYKTLQHEHGRRLEAIEARCQTHSGELRNLHIAVGGTK